MKKINSIWYGSKILAIGGVFLIVIPVFLYLVYSMIFKNDIIMLIMKISLTAGIVIILIFLLMLVIELKQDKNNNLKYNKMKYQKLQISDGLFECQHCGSKNVMSDDSFCMVCGIKFIQKKENE